MKKTIVIGASTKDYRYSNKAVCLLDDYKHEVIAIGNRKGNIRDIRIVTDKQKVENVDTVTLYLSPKHQEEYYNYILNDIKPNRIIMNPGTENSILKELAEDKGIKVEEQCTLIMLNIDTY